jgi:hypothetical protein
MRIATALSKRKSLDERNYGRRFLVQDSGVGPMLGSGLDRAPFRKGTKTMAFSLAPLLIHSDAVPQRARDALRVAALAPVAHRKHALVSAARILHAETALNCEEALEIVGLQDGCGCD